MQAVVEQPDDRPALAHVAQLAERAQVAQESLCLVAAVEAQNGVDQGVGLGRSPLFGHGLRLLPVGNKRQRRRSSSSMLAY